MPEKRQAVAPITDYFDPDGALQLPYTFCNGIVFTQYPQWARLDDDCKLLTPGHAQNLGDARLALCYSYEGDGIGAVHPSSIPTRQIAWEHHILRQLGMTSLALWLAKPTSCAFDVILFFVSIDAVDHLQQTMKIQRLLHHPNHAMSHLEMQNIHDANETLKILQQLEPEDTLLTALNLLFEALKDRLWQARFAFCWIVLESLFGADSEITFRLSQRAALFLGTTSDERSVIFKQMKEGYGWRCKLVHGARLAKLNSDKSGELSAFAESIIRRAFNKILPNEELRKIFDGKTHDEFLDGLALR